MRPQFQDTCFAPNHTNMHNGIKPHVCKSYGATFTTSEKDLQVKIPIKKTTKKPAVKRPKSTVKELPPRTNDETTETSKQVTKISRGRAKVLANSNVSLVEKEDTSTANAKKIMTVNINTTLKSTRATTRSTRKKMAPKNIPTKQTSSSDSEKGLKRKMGDDEYDRKRSKKNYVKEKPVELTEPVQPEKDLQVKIPIKKTTKKPAVKRPKSTVKELPPRTNDETTETSKQVTKISRGRAKVLANSNVSLVEKEDTSTANAKKIMTVNINTTLKSTRATTRSTRKKMAPKNIPTKQTSSSDSEKGLKRKMGDDEYDRKRSKKNYVKEKPVELTEPVQPEKDLQVKIPIKKTTKKPAVKRPKSTVKELPPRTNDETTETSKQVTKISRGRAKASANSNVSLVEKEDTSTANAKKLMTVYKSTSEPTKNTNPTPKSTRATTRSTRKKMAPKSFLTKQTFSNKKSVLESSSSSSSSSCSSCSEEHLSSDSEEDLKRKMGDDEYDRMEVESKVARDLNLSTSTSTVSEACRQISLPPNNKHIDIDAISALVDQLPSCLSGINNLLETRLAGIVRPEMAPDFEEIEVIKMCRNLFPVRPASEEPFVRPAPRLRRSERPDPKKIQEKPLPPPERPPVVEKPREDVASEDIHYNSFDHEDDDALSLFAESITSIESSHVSSAVDEYIPAPIVPSFAPRRYRMTIIRPQRSTAVKHFADTTSVKDASAAQIQYPEPQYKEEQCPEIKQELAEQQPMEQFFQRQHSQEKTDIPILKQKFSNFLKTQSTQQSAVQQPVKPQDSNSFAVPSVPYRPPLASQSLSHVTPPTHGQSLFFRGICFRYLFLNQCPYDPCRFMHSEPSRDEMRHRLRGLKDEVVLRELALVWKYPKLRQSFAGIFVQELVTRRITRAKMETLESAVEENHPLETAATEAVLLHLNSVDLMEVQDTLKHSLCVELLSTMANTQNFSRFRAVFCKLAQLVAEKRHIVPLDVTSNILERVCILPCEENLARAMLALIKQTDPSIYDNEMMPTFEMHLAIIGGLGHEEYFLEKGREKRPKAKSPTLEPEQQERYTSPDTTHYDNLNQVPISPWITRTVNLKRARTDTTVVTYASARPPPNQNNFEWYQRKYPRLQRPVGPRPQMRLNGSPMRHNRSLMRPFFMTPNGPRHF